jgi:Protein of unknown function (DUF1598)
MPNDDIHRDSCRLFPGTYGRTARLWLLTAILIPLGALSQPQVTGQVIPPDREGPTDAVAANDREAQREDAEISVQDFEEAVQAAFDGDREQAATLADQIPSSLQRNTAYREIARALESIRNNDRPNKKPSSAPGGGTQADFGPLINLITSTLSPDTWDANGGRGAVVPFPAGVLIDSQGVLQRTKIADASSREKRSPDLGRSSTTAKRLRMVSLPRLERTVLRQLLAGQPIPDIALKLAGLQRITHIVVDPIHNDLILAGPYDESDPALRLDDLLVLYHNARLANGRFGCSIEPRRENLARTQRFLKTSNRSPLPVGGYERWQDQLRQTMGRQDIVVEGVAHSTRVARVIVAADYHMKLIGMGIEPGGPNVPSYLESFERNAADDNAQPMDVLRWWFTLDYDAILFDPKRSTFCIEGDGVRVLSESELLDERGERLHTGHSSPENAAFAKSFSDNYMFLCEEYSIYRQFLAICDLAMACGIIEQEKLAEKCNWSPQWWETPMLEGLVPRASSPREVDTVVSYRKLGRTRFVTGVSGGVSIDTAYEWTSKQQPLDIQKADGIVSKSKSLTSYETLQRWYWDEPE